MSFNFFSSIKSEFFDVEVDVEFKYTMKYTMKTTRNFFKAKNLLVKLTVFP